MKNAEKIAIALDLKTEDEIFSLIKKINSYPVWLKIGLESFYRFGNSLIHVLHDQGFKIFLDLKLHDIPVTVHKALSAISHLPIDMINVHSLGGLEMMKEAKKAVELFPSKPKLIAVTWLTSHEESEIEKKMNQSFSQSILTLAKDTKEAGLDGVVCSPKEITLIKNICGLEFLLITPGIRLETQDKDDQKRILTPKEALHLGSHLLVIGRPITEAKNPQLVLEQILESFS